MDTYTAFARHRRLASGPLEDVTRAVQQAGAEGVFVYEDSSGRVVDLAIAGRGPAPLGAVEVAAEEPARGRGRPKLGVVAREVTLLPRHWDWLSTQPGGASVAVRKLVEEARRTRGDADRRRAAQEAAYRFMSSMAGDFAGFEPASRALFAYDRRRFGELVAGWPEDVRDHAIKLAFADLEA